MAIDYSSLYVPIFRLAILYHMFIARSVRKTQGMKYRTRHFSQFPLPLCNHWLCRNSKTWDTITDFNRHRHSHLHHSHLLMQLLISTIIDSGVPGPAKSVEPLRYFQATSELWDWLDIVILFRLLKRNHSDTTEKYKKPSLTYQSRLLFAVFVFRLRLRYALLQ